MKIRVISIGRPPEQALASLMRPYHKRLTGLGYHVELVSVPSVDLPPPKKQLKELAAVEKHILKNSFLLLLDESGRSMATSEFAKLLSNIRDTSRPLTIVIGGAYGVSETLKLQSSAVIKLSDMTFPHQLVRLIIFEQLYRAADILSGGSYHHE